MANHASAAGLGPLGTLFTLGRASSLSDAQLLERFTTEARASRTAEAAFETLIARHGPMVLGVCRRALADPRDVEDAFQATFLVLVRKSSVVRVDDSLGRWLYGVARRVAQRARQTAERRRRRETAPAGSWEPSTSAQASNVEQTELLAALDDELVRLPEKYRKAVRLCDLEGLSHSEAARRLQWPVGTVKGRLLQGRTLLRGRLTRRGLAPSALAMLGAALPAPLRAEVPPGLAASTVRSALQHALGGPAAAASASAAVDALTRGALRAMLWTKVKWAAVGLLACQLTAGALAPALADRGDGDGDGADAAATIAARDRATLRPANAVAVVSDVASDATIVRLLPDGSNVKRGDVLCRLDATALKAQLARQIDATQAAAAAVQGATHDREIVEAIHKYVDGVDEQERDKIDAEIEPTKSERSRAEDRLTWAARMRAKGYVSNAQLTADALALASTIVRQEQAEKKKQALEKSTRQKTIKTLKSDVEKLRSDELAKLQILDREKTKQAALENQIQHCRITAPVAGRLEYAQASDRDGLPITIAHGATVRWGQLLFWIIPKRRDGD